MLTHLKEIKNIIRYLIIYSLILLSLCYFYSDVLLFKLVKPLINQENWISQRFIFTNLTEAFLLYIIISTTLICYIWFPFCSLRIRRFSSRGRFEHERKKIKKVFFVLCFLFLFSLYFSYSSILPNLWYFLLDFQTYSIDKRIVIELEAKLTEYILLILKIIQFFRLSFQFPLIIVLRTQFKIISVLILLKTRKLAIVFFLMRGARLSPPDLYSQILIAIPLIILYEVTLFSLIILEKKQKAK